ncbi:tripartite tricarboxylate transporter substrate binding protein [Bordetella bronchialis]|uniref:Tat pathway signal protein n=1 Tax=Bordetella bronchialis TaxID=463025 RepID=A0A193FL17_9BORD|nr:tripartite tricarboxylate transporter substrate binding protein [Bordetella bronchialis]ANN68457.1 Tat pathway signal protein [Bordetella bronchialis]ANN73599.1 Tat pathway signal protein [Bordetella bronchialis]
MGSTFKAAAAALALCAATVCQAQDNWPAKPITMIVPFPPGGVADTVARPVADAMSRSLKQSVVVENRAGAGGGLGMGVVARAEPDGYTVLMALSSISIIPEADRILGRAPMYQLNQFKPIARFTADPTVLVVRADSPWKTAREFIDDLKRPDATPVSYGSSGNYGTMHVPMEMLHSAAGIKVLHVPYGGAGPAIVALLGGQVQAVSTGPASVLQYIQAGKVRALATWGETRLAALPDVPTLKELGYDVTFAQWSGLFVPAATPEPIVRKLRAAAEAAAKDPKVRDTIQQAGSPILYLDAADFQAYWDADAAKMREAVRKIGKVE